MKGPRALFASSSPASPETIITTPQRPAYGGKSLGSKTPISSYVSSSFSSLASEYEPVLQTP